MREGNLRAIVSWIEDNLNENIDAKMLEQISGYSFRNILNIFKQYAGISPGRYIRQRRLCKAAYLLRLTDQKIIDISYFLHFDSQQSFCREFKKLFGYSPRSYRKVSYWDFTGLLPPYNPDKDYMVKVEFCTLQKRMLFGYSVHYDEAIQGRKNHVLRYDAIIRNLKYCQRDILMCTHHTPLPGSMEKCAARLFIGVTGCSVDDSLLSKTYDCECGDYLKAEFKGTWEEYNRFAFFLYSNVLPAFKIKRRNGADIENFHFIASEGEYEQIKCDYYIPVYK